MGLVATSWPVSPGSTLWTVVRFVVTRWRMGDSVAAGTVMERSAHALGASWTSWVLSETIFSNVVVIMPYRLSSTVKGQWWRGRKGNERLGSQNPAELPVHPLAGRRVGAECQLS